MYKGNTIICDTCGMGLTGDAFVVLLPGLEDKQFCTEECLEDYVRENMITSKVCLEVEGGDE